MYTYTCESLVTAWMITLMLIPLRNCQNLEVDRVRVLCIHIHVYTIMTQTVLDTVESQKSCLWKISSLNQVERQCLKSKLNRMASCSHADRLDRMLP